MKINMAICVLQAVGANVYNNNIQPNPGHINYTSCYFLFS